MRATPVQISFARYATDPKLAGNVLGRPSYTPMRAVIKAALAERLTADERAAAEHLVGGRALPGQQVGELVIVAGRGSGKTQAAAALAVYLGTCRAWKCDPGQVPVVLLLAADREQAAVAFRFVLGTLQAAPLLRNEIVRETAARVVLRSRVELQVATSDFRAVRGRSLVAVVADELAFWPVTPESDSPDTEVLTAVRPGLARFDGSMLVAISTVYAQRGALYEFDRRYFGQNDARVFVARGTTRDFNATFPQSVIDDALARDPAAAGAEYLSVYRTDVASFLDAKLIDSCTRSEPRELQRRLATATGTPLRYVAGIDLSGGRNDAAACAIAHAEGERVVVDACRRWPSPHDPAAVAAQVRDFLKLYGLASASGDHYAAEISRSLYAGLGVQLMAAELVRSEIYLRLLPLLTTGRAELPPEPMLRVELLGLERRTARSGRDSVDHSPHAHDDLANAVALAALTAARFATGNAGEQLVVATRSTHSTGYLDLNKTLAPSHFGARGPSPWNF